MTRIPRALPVVLIAAFALVLAFSGGAVAGKLITGKQIKDNSVSTKDIKNGSLQSLDLSASTIAELQSGEVGPAGPEGPAGAMGATGADGVAGPAGPAGTNGVSGLEYVTGTVIIGAGVSDAVTVLCPGSKKVIGAVADWQSTYLPTATTFNQARNGAIAYGKNTNAAVDTLRLTISCITAS